MISLSDKQIKDIADSLGCGEKVFVQLQTGNIIAIPDFEQFGDETKEFCEEELEELENNRSNYLEIEQLSSSDSFEIMEKFTAQLSDKNPLKSRLITALENRKPFANFRNLIDNSGEYRQEWFDFKNAQMKQWVADKIEEAKQ